jgi:hypothetical protein
MTTEAITPLRHLRELMSSIIRLPPCRCHRHWAVGLGALGPQPGLSSFLPSKPGFRISRISAHK